MHFIIFDILFVPRLLFALCRLRPIPLQCELQNEWELFFQPLFSTSHTLPHNEASRQTPQKHHIWLHPFIPIQRGREGERHGFSIITTFEIQQTHCDRRTRHGQKGKHASTPLLGTCCLSICTHCRYLGVYTFFDEVSQVKISQLVSSIACTHQDATYRQVRAEQKTFSFLAMYMHFCPVLSGCTRPLHPVYRYFVHSANYTLQNRTRPLFEKDKTKPDKRSTLG
mmetsp:Transcript_31072/g.81549  ORF Transcript_31072/g.81549 Transcript_31072/m.81549 type:complete len:225 (-) Transcript_31072:683-1357(-)